jgi:hypothetical protein
LGIYERSLLLKKQTERKLEMIKKNKLEKEVAQCTFAPNISDTLEFFNKKNPKFFDEGQKEILGGETRFEKLYKQSFDLRQKRKQRLRTL